MSIVSQFLRRKAVEDTLAEVRGKGHGLDRAMGLFELTMLGVGSTIGTGIFVILAEAVPRAGPATLVSFLIASITAGLTALCYAELASCVPASGSSYSFAYVTLGEGAANLVAWFLLLEYGLAGGAVAVSWGQYINELLQAGFDWQLPAAISAPPGQRGAVFNLPGVLLVGLCCLLLIRRVSESAAVNAVMVVIKIAVLVFFSAVALSSFSLSHFHPFAPMGLSGVGAAASSIFFSYTGIDAISTAGEETKDPRRTLPRAVILSLVIITIIYLLVAAAAIGAQPWTRFAGQEASLAVILRESLQADWPSVVLTLGAMVSLFSVTLVIIYGQSRILFAMSHDGMLPKIFGRVDSVRRTPVANTLLVGGFIALLAGCAPLEVLTDLTSMGTLAAFFVVSISVILLRRSHPALDRPFRVPLYPAVPILSAASCLYLIYGLPARTFGLFALWSVAALVVYFAYGRRHSHLRP